MILDKQTLINVDYCFKVLLLWSFCFFVKNVFLCFLCIRMLNWKCYILKVVMVPNRKIVSSVRYRKMLGKVKILWNQHIYFFLFLTQTFFSSLFTRCSQPYILPCGNYKVNICLQCSVMKLHQQKNVQTHTKILEL